MPCEVSTIVSTQPLDRATRMRFARVCVGAVRSRDTRQEKRAAVQQSVTYTQTPKE